MSLLQVLPLVEKNVDAKARFKACLSCPAKQRHLFANWCGVPIVGSEYIHEGTVRHLCGCACKQKVKVDEETCPLNRWPK